MRNKAFLTLYCKVNENEGYVVFNLGEDVSSVNDIHVFVLAVGYDVQVMSIFDLVVHAVEHVEALLVVIAVEFIYGYLVVKAVQDDLDVRDGYNI